DQSSLLPRGFLGRRLGPDRRAQARPARGKRPPGQLAETSHAVASNGPSKVRLKSIPRAHTDDVPTSRVTVLVTGASSGFGQAISRRFARSGAQVVVAARRADRLAELAAELGPGVLPLELDVRDWPAVERGIATLPDPFAEIDVLVNNAGLAKGLE